VTFDEKFSVIYWRHSGCTECRST